MEWLKRRFIRNKCKEENTVDRIRKCSVYYLPCDSIRPNALRSRSDFDEDKLVKLAYSIKKYGVIEPLCVRNTDEDDAYDYELIAGERRLRAARLAGFSTVPCVIIDVDERFSAEISLVENLYRDGLDCFEIAFALKRITELSEDSFDSLAQRLNISKEDITRKLYLLELSFDERQILLERGVSEEICSDIGRISDAERRAELISLISENNASDADVRSYLGSAKSGGREIPRDVSALIKGIRRKVELFDRRGKRTDTSVSENGSSVTITVRVNK